MIVSMKLGATKEQIERVCNRIEDMGFQVRSIQGDERIVIAAVGVEDVTHGIETMRSAEGVESAVPISAPYKLVSKQVRQERTVVAVGDATVGGSEFAVFAGPLLGRNRAANQRLRRGGSRCGRKVPARRRLQAALESLQLPGPRRSGLEAVAQRRGLGGGSRSSPK